MSNISEIKCPKCGQWNPWTDKEDDKCAGCGNYLEPDRHRHAEEVKVQDSKMNYLVIKETDENLVQLGKIFINGLRWGSYLGAVVFFLFIAAMIVVFGLIFI